jgi:hypothetical protein
MSGSLLEDRYRLVLRMLPVPYRAKWEEEMVSAFLESAYAVDPDDPEGVKLGRPSRAEVVSVAALALRLRLGGPGAPPRAVAVGEAIRRVALVGLLAHGVSALAGVLLDVWVVKRLPGIVIPADAPMMFPDRWQALWGLTPLLWLPAYLSVLYGYRRWARVFGAVAFLPVVVSTVRDLMNPYAAYGPSRWYWLAFSALPVLALAAFHRDARPVVPRPWLVALPVGTVAYFALVLLTWPADGQVPLLDWAGMWCVGMVVANAGYLARALTRPDAASVSWTFAFTWLSVIVLGYRLVSMSDFLGYGVPAADRPTILAIDLGQASVLLGTALAVGLVTRGVLRESRNAVG